MAEWQFGEKYRARASAAQAIVKRLPKTNTACVEVLVMVTMGPKANQTLFYTGWLNSPANRARTRKELEAMGWKGKSWDDFSGLGSKEFRFRCMSERGKDGKEYPRVAFVEPLPKVDVDNAMRPEDVAAIPFDEEEESDAAEPAEPESS